KVNKILFLPKYTRMGASSRLRTYQYLPLWEKAGYNVVVRPFFTDKYLNEIYAGRRPGILHILQCYWRRAWQLFTVGKYDLIFVEKELFPYLPAFAEWFLAKTKGFIVDYDDAVFHNYDLGKYPGVKRFLPDKIDRTMKMAELVTVGNSYLKDRAWAAGSSRIVMMPTVIDPNRYLMKIHQDKPIVSIGWIGSPSTLRYLEGILPVLEQLKRKFKIILVQVNGKNQVKFSGSTEKIPWTEAGEVDAILKMDIGIMPLPDNPWERGKCAYKLIQYMACGLPVVASPVGMNKEVVQHGINGYLAKSEEEWIAALSKLIQDWQLRKSFGENGHQLVMEKYTLERNFEKMLEMVAPLNPPSRGDFGAR
ncbi:MAG: glycosyltransferase family 4 protein, partial [Cyclobacteriaceae bacterium]